jgi:hypothetical protein
MHDQHVALCAMHADPADRNAAQELVEAAPWPLRSALVATLAHVATAVPGTKCVPPALQERVFCALMDPSVRVRLTAASTSALLLSCATRLCPATPVHASIATSCLTNWLTSPRKPHLRCCCRSSAAVAFRASVHACRSLRCTKRPADRPLLLRACMPLPLPACMRMRMCRACVHLHTSALQRRCSRGGGYKHARACTEREHACTAGVHSGH